MSYCNRLLLTSTLFILLSNTATLCAMQPLPNFRPIFYIEVSDTNEFVEAVGTCTDYTQLLNTLAQIDGKISEGKLLSCAEKVISKLQNNQDTVLQRNMLLMLIKLVKQKQAFALAETIIQNLRHSQDNTVLMWIYFLLRELVQQKQAIPLAREIAGNPAINLNGEPGTLEAAQFALRKLQEIL